MKLGVSRELNESVAPDVGLVMDSVFKTLEKMGAEIVSVEFPLFRYCLPVYYILACAEASSNLGRFDGLRYGYSTQVLGENDPEQPTDTGSISLDDFICQTRSNGFGAEVKRRILLGTCVLSTGYYDAYYNKAIKLKNAIKNEFKHIFTKCDCMITPTVPTTALKSGLGHGSKVYQTDINTVAANIAGLPAVSVPCGFGNESLPVGMQIIGDKFCEDVILGVAYAFETETSGASTVDKIAAPI